MCHPPCLIFKSPHVQPTASGCFQSPVLLAWSQTNDSVFVFFKRVFWLIFNTKNTELPVNIKENLNAHLTISLNYSTPCSPLLQLDNVCSCSDNSKVKMYFSGTEELAWLNLYSLITHASQHCHVCFHRTQCFNSEIISSDNSHILSIATCWKKKSKQMRCDSSWVNTVNRHYSYWCQPCTL